MSGTDVAPWKNPHIWAIGLAGFGMGYGTLWSGNTAFWLLSAVTYGGSTYFDPINVLLRIGFLAAIFVLGVYGSKRVRGLPLYFSALICSLSITAGLFALALLRQNQWIGNLQAYWFEPIAGEISFVGIMMLTILIAHAPPSKRFAQILVFGGATSLGGAISHFDASLSLANQAMSHLSLEIAVPALLISCTLFLLNRNFYLDQKLNWSEPIHFIRTSLRSLPLRRVILIILLMEIAQSTTGWFDMGERTFFLSAMNGFVLGIGIILIGTLQSRITSSSTTFLLRTTQIAFALILVSSAALRFDWFQMFTWLGVFGSGGLYISGLAALAWYIAIADKTSPEGLEPDYPKFILILLIVQALPAPLVSFSFSQFQQGTDPADVFSVVGLLTTSVLLVAVLAWVPRRTEK